MIKHFNKFVFRTPLLPIGAFQQINEYDTIDEYLHHILSHDEVQEALYIASPVFYAEVEKFLIGSFTAQTDNHRTTRFRLSVLKYLNRMSSRSTPFGLFAGCGVGQVNAQSSDAYLIGPEQLDRKPKLDTSYLMFFAKGLEQKSFIKENLLFYPNNTVYRIGTKCRYVEFTDSPTGRAYNLSLFTHSDYIQAVLDAACTGATIATMSKVLVDDHISEEEATVFINQLIDAKIFISELEPMIVGLDYQQQLLDVIARLRGLPLSAEQQNSLTGYHTYLLSLLAALDKVEQKKNIPHYRWVEEAINQHHGHAINHFLQVDTGVVAEQQPRISEELARQIRNGIKYFAKLCTIYPNQKLKEFKYHFQRRYDEHLVPLL